MISMLRQVRRAGSCFNSMRRFIAQRAPVYKRTMEWIKNFVPDNLIVSKMEPPVLRRKPDNILVKNWDRESGRNPLNSFRQRRRTADPDHQLQVGPVLWPVHQTGPGNLQPAAQERHRPPSAGLRVQERLEVHPRHQNSLQRNPRSPRHPTRIGKSDRKKALEEPDLAEDELQVDSAE